MATNLKKRDLMIQKINLSDAMLLIWENTLRRLVNAPSSKYKIFEDDIHQKFDVEQDDKSVRTFSVEGITDEDFIMLKEYTTNGELFWMCKYEYVQSLLGRFNNKIKYNEEVNKKTKFTKTEFTLSHKEYTDTQLYLPNKHARRKKKEEEVEETEVFDEVLPFLFEDDDATCNLAPDDEIESETIIE